jgi:hypothetical protein
MRLAPPSKNILTISSCVQFDHWRSVIAYNFGIRIIDIDYP